jgi:FAD/FMN-containing dehydrogenase
MLLIYYCNRISLAEANNVGKLLWKRGTLAFTTEVTLQLDDLPPTNNVMVVTHFNSIQESLRQL